MNLNQWGWPMYAGVAVIVLILIYFVVGLLYYFGYADWAQKIYPFGKRNP